MKLDIRLPIGLLFGALGAILAVFGLVSNHELYQRSLGINVNLIWGLALLLFGVVMLYFGRKGTSSARLAEEDPEGRAMMEREKELTQAK